MSRGWGRGFKLLKHNALPCLGGPLTRLPAAVPADGNCLFHALSTAIAGDTSLSTELRVRTCIEMVVNKDLYKKKHKNTGVKFVSPDYRTAVRECAIGGKFSSAWTIHAAASVLGTKILSIYPPVNGLLDKTVSILHRTFNPNKDCSPRPPIVLMWSNVSRPRTGVTWLPNHFVPLLLTKPPEVVDMTESVEKTIRNDDPKTSTPKKKVKLYVIFII
jgi:hypothetical protein